ncbi:kinesin, partial [Trypanosoma theileri]
MLGKPQVRVLVRFRPLNEEEVQKQQEGSHVEETPWIQYDEKSVEIIERIPAQVDGLSSPYNNCNNNCNNNNKQSNHDCSDNNIMIATTTTTSSSIAYINGDTEASGTPDVQSQTTTALIRPRLRKTFTFDDVLADSTDQQETFKHIGVPVLSNILKGYNSTILAYGQTGSGKTHSMLGPAGGKLNCYSPDSSYYESRGLIPRVVEALFNYLTDFNPTERTWRVRASMFEIYMDNIIDLFCSGPQASEYRIREDTESKGVYVESLEQVHCIDAKQLLELVGNGIQRRHTSATGSNDTSSRSHFILSLFLEQEDILTGGTNTVSRLNFVDLAGSEKVFPTLAESDRLREAQCINLSLALLGNVIHRLTNPKPGYVPFRDCKLTRILQDSLGGNALTTLLCHASTAMMNRNETITTLRFAEWAKKIRNRPRVNKTALTQQEFGLDHASAVVRAQQLQLRGQMPNGLIESQRPSLDTVSGIDTIEQQELEEENENEKKENLQSIIDALMNEVMELKKELNTKEEELQHSSETVEFYKQQCTLLKQEYDEVCERHKAREEKLLNMCASMDQERKRLLAEIEELQFNITSTGQSNWKPIAPVVHVGNSLTLQDSTKSESGVPATTVVHPLNSIHTIVIPKKGNPNKDNKSEAVPRHTDPVENVDPTTSSKEGIHQNDNKLLQTDEENTRDLNVQLDTLDQHLKQNKENPIDDVNTARGGLGKNPLQQEQLASSDHLLQQGRKQVHANTMTDLAATELQQQEELATAQRAQQEKELVHANTMTDLAATELQEQE